MLDLMAYCVGMSSIKPIGSLRSFVGANSGINPDVPYYAGHTRRIDGAHPVDHAREL